MKNKKIQNEGRETFLSRGRTSFDYFQLGVGVVLDNRSVGIGGEERAGLTYVIASW
jgi:hypothetical protein